ncbi:hypothetical protein H257_06826 [Aphanomyces astaci]|uniref:Uncharacterized protein n=1 Tax=Aphanomyces astaci TaxID=112090 RepID=W4GIS8_APHAT|nr:hypothetical protein H257_06826 [Aphanomyces astaci]ETV79562.1 hypothetical protein H257_06826 [Aphanomyces astaci]|eukprot:XP_009830498.1 hypothetical protein H257_06826 [Aphanomyces astaci]
MLRRYGRPRSSSHRRFRDGERALGPERSWLRLRLFRAPPPLPPSSAAQFDALKKANVEEDSQVYHLVDVTYFPCLHVCVFNEEYIAILRTTGQNMGTSTFVFPN